MKKFLSNFISRNAVTATILFTVLFSASTLFASGTGAGASSGPLANSYPIVLSHGILGFDDSNGPLGNLLSYWGGMDDYLRGEGVDVITPGSTATTSVAVRAQQQKDLINQWMAANGYSKVNIMAHSQGGLVSRYMISNLGMKSKVRILTTINTPHYGTPTADISMNVIPGWLHPYVGAALDFFSDMFYTDSESDIIAMAKSLTVNVASSFNANTPNKSGVKYYSYGSYMYEDLIQHPIMSIVCPITFIGAPFYGMSTYNDGVVPYDSQKWGTWKGRPGDYWYATGLDHLQMTNFEWTGQTYFDVEGHYLKMAKNAMNNE